MGLRTWLNSKAVKGDTGEPTYLTWKEVLSYALGRGAQGMGTSMMSSNYVNFFITNIRGISMEIAGSIRLFCGMWDAVNDVILGVIVDKTNSKYGKMRPYIRYAPYVCALFTILFFMNGDSWSYPMMLMFSTVTFVGWDMAYTAVDIPIGALAFSMTPNSIERAKLYGVSAIVRMIAGALPAGFVGLALAIPHYQQNTAPAYHIAAIVSAAGMVLLTRFTFYNTRERTQRSEEKPTVAQCFRLLLQNRPLFMLFIANIFFLLAMVPAHATVYFSVDLMGSGKYDMMLGIAAGPAQALAGLVVPKLAEKLGEKVDFRRFYIWCCVIAAGIHALFFAVCWSGLMNKPSTQEVSLLTAVLVILFYGVSKIPLEFKNLCSKELEAESVDYVEWKTGERVEGIMMSLISFTGKLSNSGASAIALFILGLANYAEHETAVPVVQTFEARLSLFALYTLVPLLGYLLMLIPLKFYNITRKSHKQMLADIAERRTLKEGEGTEHAPATL